MCNVIHLPLPVGVLLTGSVTAHTGVEEEMFRVGRNAPNKFFLFKYGVVLTCLGSALSQGLSEEYEFQSAWYWGSLENNGFLLLRSQKPSHAKYAHFQ